MQNSQPTWAAALATANSASSFGTLLARSAAPL